MLCMPHKTGINVQSPVNLILCNVIVMGTSITLLSWTQWLRASERGPGCQN